MGGLAIEMDPFGKGGGAYIPASCNFWGLQFVGSWDRGSSVACSACGLSVGLSLPGDKETTEVPVPTWLLVDPWLFP